MFYYKDVSSIPILHFNLIVYCLKDSAKNLQHPDSFDGKIKTKKNKQRKIESRLQFGNNLKSIWKILRQHMLKKLFSHSPKPSTHSTRRRSEREIKAPTNIVGGGFGKIK